MNQSNLKGSGDCALFNLVWKLIWDPTSELYLPNVIKNGLNDPSLGINISPFNTVDIGDFPEITMFKEPVLGYMKIYLSDCQLEGLGSITKGTLQCNDSSSDKTTFTVTFPFSLLDFSGKYGVSAGGGIAGCSIAAAAAILGGDAYSPFPAAPLTLSDDDPVNQNIDQSLWYRQPLSDHENGQLMLGAYYQDNPAVYDLVNEPGSLLAQSMKLADVKTTTDQVNMATTWYYKQQNGLEAEDDEAPQIGTSEQYASGGLPSAYALAMARQKVNSGQDPDGRYARLVQHIIHFTGSITYYQKQYPGTQPIGGDGGVLDNIAKADPEEVNEFVMNNGPYPVIDMKNGGIKEYIDPEPLDPEELKKVYALKSASWKTGEGSGKVDGTFTDTGINVTLSVSGNLTETTDSGVQCAITNISSSIQNIRIHLSQEKGWWPGLYDKVTNWLANTGFVTNMIKDKLNDQLNSQDMKDKLAEIINGGLKKLSS